jgi:hypothetical protein
MPAKNSISGKATTSYCSAAVALTGAGSSLSEEVDVVRLKK